MSYHSVYHQNPGKGEANSNICVVFGLHYHRNNSFLLFLCAVLIFASLKSIVFKVCEQEYAPSPNEEDGIQ